MARTRDVTLGAAQRLLRPVPSRTAATLPGAETGEHLNHVPKTTMVRVRRRLVYTTYLDVKVPATHTPSFTVDPDAHFIPVGGLVDLVEPPSGYTVLGAGKTAMDACTWLLENGVDPDRIRWVRPRDAWLLDRACPGGLTILACRRPSPIWPNSPSRP